MFNFKQKANKNPLRLEFSSMTGRKQKHKKLKSIMKNCHLWCGCTDYEGGCGARLVPAWHLHGAS